MTSSFGDMIYDFYARCTCTRTYYRRVSWGIFFVLFLFFWIAILRKGSVLFYSILYLLDLE